MAAITPVQLFPGYQLAGATAISASNAIIIPLAALPALTAAEAAATGDGREVSRALIEQITASIEGLLATAKPNKMTATRSNPSGTVLQVLLAILTAGGGGIALTQIQKSVRK
jgi:hypothetical protein